MDKDKTPTRAPTSSTAALTVLVVDDEAPALKQLGRILRGEGFEIALFASGQEALAHLAAVPVDLVVTDLMLDDVSGLELLAAAKQIDPGTEVILITGYGSVDGAIEATKRGAFHYLPKPIRPDELRSIVRQAAQKRRLGRRLRELENETSALRPRLVGTSPKLRELRALIRQIEHSDANVLITGESGTGKELVAREIHHTSSRASRRLVAFNCASLTDELLANELFGHEEGAFTGAHRLRKGLLETACGGTVFFDEVGDMSLAMQAKLLRVVQERELIRVGGADPISVDIRIIAATNKDLKKLAQEGRFRQDLFFRLNVISVQVPSLHERREDIPVLAQHFLRQLGLRTGRAPTGFSVDALGLLLDYDFPGNVRELENVVERSASLASGTQIEVEDLPSDLRDFEAFTFHRGGGGPRLKTLRQLEWEYIQWVLGQVGHNKTRAAQILGIDRVSLYRKIQRRAFED